ncbi:MAG: patatin-like phospholipase family protein [Bacteroidota bacterium]|nr:patatin-like phospholipase family protein [Bacteroidota bacterium]
MSNNNDNTKASSLFQQAQDALKTEQFSSAWSLLEEAKQHDHDGQLRTRIEQKQVVATYKDEERPQADRLDAALKQLTDGPLQLNKSNDPETLGLAGAVYKRKWLSGLQPRDLQLSFDYYYKGYLLREDKDNGFNGINAAFLLDVKAKYADAGPEASAQFRAQAEAIRRDIIDTFSTKAETSNDWWLLVTLAEAHFGLEQYGQAEPWLIRGIQLSGQASWELATTFSQLARVALLREPDGQDIEKSPAWSVLLKGAAELGFDAAALETTFMGKVGLALSGGGFRASLYHIGVLAKLAELDMLRKVEVISCVSGGSIIGAAYYLEVRNLLQTKTDLQITSQDYIDIVKRLSDNFLKGIQRNLRMRIMANLWENWHMALSDDYSRTNRLGELYEKELFALVTDGEEQEPRWLNMLFIHPMKTNGEQDKTFQPKHHNWQRRAKAPILILNATTLNTGHNWQFTASWMGEPPSGIQKIDANYRLRRMYNKTGTSAHSGHEIRLGQAVAASSCVPAMFPPIVLKDLYQDKTVKLVDGGVHDNQGVCGLLDQDCSVLLVSDASGQMTEEDQPTSNTLPVYSRTSDILMERVRNEQFLDMRNRLQGGMLRGLMFIHLKLGLDAKTIDWIDKGSPAPKTQSPAPYELTAYHIRKDLQRKLSAIRTDLDSFHNAEAFALMTSGYHMTTSEFPDNIKGFRPVPAVKQDWEFLCAANILQAPGTPALSALLDTSSNLFLKIWRLTPWLRKLTVTILLLLIGGMIALGIFDQWRGLSTLWTWTQYSLLVLAGVALVQLTLLAMRFRVNLLGKLIAFLLLTVGWVVTHIHLRIFDPLYLKKGKKCN